MLDLSTKRQQQDEDRRERQPRKKNKCKGPGVAGVRTEKQSLTKAKRAWGDWAT